MTVPVVKVRVVRMLMFQRCMAMGMRVRFARRVVGPMLMPVMGVMGVAMVVIQRLVPVFMRVGFGQVQVEPDRHQ